MTGYLIGSNVGLLKVRGTSATVVYTLASFHGRMYNIYRVVGKLFCYASFPIAIGQSLCNSFALCNEFHDAQ